ncbi:MAG: hypothetical protein Q8L40_11940 [Burkholderiales bacterium]|nr:hypothetical protein [Burkholderiales bacterium]
MTLVVTEVSEAFGCVVVGDSAVTIGTNVVFGAEKVQYSAEAMIGFALWGNACLAGRRVDELVSSFVSQITRATSPRSAGRDLSALLTSEGKKDGRDWKELRGGVHICGYEGSVPVLFHVHTGHEPPAPQGPFQLYEDFPDASHLCHLRNGYYKMFGTLFDGMQQYAAGLHQLGFKWPNEAVEDRVSYYSIMINTVAQTLKAAGRVPSVGEMVSAFAFNRNGIQVDKRLPSGTEDFCRAGGTMTCFCEPPSNPSVESDH